MATNATRDSDKSPTTDASADDNRLSAAALARESTAHFDGGQLKDWDVIEASFDATAATLRRLTEGQA